MNGAIGRYERSKATRSKDATNVHSETLVSLPTDIDPRPGLGGVARREKRSKPDELDGLETRKKET